MAHGIFFHIHTHPDRVHPLHIIIAGILKVPLLLGGNQPAHIKDGTVQDFIPSRLILLGFHIDDNLCQLSLSCFPRQPHIKDYVKPDKSFLEFSAFCVKASQPFPIPSPDCIGKSRFHRHSADTGSSFDIPFNLPRIHALKLIHCLYQNVSKDALLPQQSFGTCIILCL